MRDVPFVLNNCSPERLHYQTSPPPTHSSFIKVTSGIKLFEEIFS